MSVHVSAIVRQEVRQRASNICEYCLIREADTLLDHQAEHVVSMEHGGPTVLDNLAPA